MHVLVLTCWTRATRTVTTCSYTVLDLVLFVVPRRRDRAVPYRRMNRSARSKVD